MVGTYITAEFNLVVLIGKVETGLFRCYKTTAAATEAASTAVGEPLAIKVVGRHDQSILGHIVIVVCGILEPVAFLGTVAGVGI